MPKHSDGKLKAATCALVFSSYLGLWSASRFGTEVLLVPVLALMFMPLGEWLDDRFTFFRSATSTCTFLFLLAIPFLYSMSGLLDAVVILVMYVQIYSLVHVKRAQNYYHILLMSFFLLLAASVLTPSPVISIVFLLFIGSSVSVLRFLDTYVGERGVTGVDRVTLLGGGEHEAGYKTDVVRASRAGTTLWIAALSLGVLTLTIGVFYSTPRTEIGLLGASNSGAFTTGLSSEVDLAAGGEILRDTSAVMRVRFPEEEGGRYYGEMLWRSTTFDQYIGSRWTRRGLNTTGQNQNPSRRKYAVTGGNYSLEGVNRGPIRKGKLVYQEIFLDQAHDEAAPALPLVKMMAQEEGDRSVHLEWERAGDFTVSMRRREGQAVRYRAWSETTEPKAEDLRNSSEEYVPIMTMSDYRHLTKTDLQTKTRALARRITQSAENPYDKAKAIESYLSGAGYSYTLDLPDLPKEGAVDAFIHDTKTGHCELYASAMALMLRSLGVPSRVVSGYRGGDWQSRDESYVVTADMAHLWVESFFPDYGWVTFDPSPETPQFAQTPFQAFRRRLAQYNLMAKMMWYQNVVSYEPEDRVDILKGVSLGLFGWGTESERRKSVAEPAESGAGGLQRLLFGIGFAGIFVFGLISLRRFIPGTPRATDAFSEDQSRAIALRSLMARKLNKNGGDCKGKTVAELRRLVRDGSWEDTVRALQVLEAYNAVRFGKRPLPMDTYRHLRQSVKSMRSTASA